MGHGAGEEAIECVCASRLRSEWPYDTALGLALVQGEREGFPYSASFPIIGTWSKRAPAGGRITLDPSHLEEPGKRLGEHVGLRDIVENDLESASLVMKGSSNLPLQPIVVGHSTQLVLDRVRHIVDEWSGTRDLSPFKL